jgi:sugar (pentulose or hexulose) kinase
MVEKYVMGIDVGTQAIKTAIFDLNGNLFHLHKSKYSNSLKYDEFGGVTQNPFDWYDALIEGIDECVTKVPSKKIVAMGLDTTSSTFLMTDNLGEPIGDALLWYDRRAFEQSEKILKISNNYSEYKLSKAMIPEAGLSKILWLKENDKRYRDAGKILECVDWLTYKLTGNFTASKSALIRFYNYHWDLKGWPKNYLKSINLEDLVDKIPYTKIDTGKKIGKLLPALSKKFGLSSDLEVITAGIDSYSSLVGMGVYKGGQIGITMGSSIPINIASTNNVNIESYFGPFRDLTVPGLYFNGTSIPSAGVIINWLIENSPYHDHKNPYLELDKKASQVPIGSDGLFCIPYWSGVKSPVRKSLAKGAFTGFKLSHKTDHMFRSIYEGLSYSIKHSFEKVIDSGYQINQLFICGGLTKSKLMKKILPDVLGIDLNVAYDESSVLGSAILAAYGTGLFNSIPGAINKMAKPSYIINPNKNNSKIYTSLFEEYKRIANTIIL